MPDSPSNMSPSAAIGPIVVGASMPTYEQQMSQNLEWAMSQGSNFFERRGKVQETLRRITKRLEETGVPYAVVGGMALFAHGFRRYTEDVDILVTREGLRQIHQELEGRGYIAPFERSKHLRDTETHVKIEFLTTGDFPGDGKPKPVAFPDPAAVAERIGGIQYVSLPKLIELKLAAGIAAPHRARDFADVQDTIRMLRLPRDFGDQLDPYVRDKWSELWFPAPAEDSDEQ
jgi:hypothetical protein